MFTYIPSKPVLTLLFINCLHRGWRVQISTDTGVYSIYFASESDSRCVVRVHLPQIRNQ